MHTSSCSYAIYSDASLYCSCLCQASCFLLPSGQAAIYRPTLPLCNVFFRRDPTGPSSDAICPYAMSKWAFRLPMAHLGHWISTTLSVYPSWVFATLWRYWSACWPLTPRTLPQQKITCFCQTDRALHCDTTWSFVPKSRWATSGPQTPSSQELGVAGSA